MPDNDSIFDKVYEFHGHVCLMSTAGIQIALAAMRAIGLEKSDEYLFAIYHARTCAIDPIQFITGCTLGNSNIIIEDSIRLHLLKLVRQSDGAGVSVMLKDEVAKRMRECMRRKKAVATEPDPETRVRLMEESDTEFQEMLDFLQNGDESEIVDAHPFSMDIKPYLRF